MSIFRNADGLSNVAADTPFAELEWPHPLRDQVYVNDFHTYASGDWLETVVDTDGDGNAARTIDATAGGVLNILLDDNAADSTNLALGGTGAEPFLFPTGKKAWIAAKFSSSDVDKNFMAIGVAPISDVDLQGGLPADHALILVDAADANIDVSISKNSTATTGTGLGTLSDYVEGTNNLTEVVMHYDGSSNVYVWVDGSKVASVATTNLPDDEELTVSFGIQNGAAAAKTMSIDYILAAKER